MNENFTQKINVEINRIVNQTFPIYSADSSQMGRIELANKIQYNMYRIAGKECIRSFLQEADPALIIQYMEDRLHSANN